ncbi:hypothetical protein KZZ52_22650 [Dactylosporangium sp. AC04546]|uniref:NACHT N-terminal helical domain 7-containing protein n=1 Tax=Dactylosporangium sp. AC04546 TaxID=2862460 RepID=UPI001EDE1B5A|nr:hypothetical protein [Dactylosporangium sp. AC04546]WVK88081.1 hypothetical protein KZZ52_22650 [Dactylosporangium sp. AC04546]
MQRRSATQIKYAEVRKLVQDAGADHPLLAAVDRLMSVSMLVAPLLPGAGAAALPLLSLFDAKADLIRRANELVRFFARSGYRAARCGSW